jgi:hypothetical protein
MKVLGWLSPERPVGLLQCFLPREPKVSKEMRIVGDGEQVFALVRPLAAGKPSPQQHSP